MERNNVLLKITDLRQYFPVGKKKGLYVKANDGISLNIYEGETVGLVGESGCGKSTFGRTLLQLYRQTDGKTMYYGASRDELAPEYIEKTIRHLPHGLHELAALEKKRDEMQKAYDAADEQKRLHMHNDLTAAKKAANDAYLNIVNVIGGFITAKDLGPVMKIFSERHDRCCDLHKAIEKRAPVKLNYDEEAFKLSKLKAGERGYDSRKGKLDKLAEKVAVIYNNADAYSTGVYQTFDAEAKKLGLEVVAVSTFTDDTTDFSVQVTAAKEAGADLVFLPIYYTPASMILMQANAMGYAPTFFGCDGMDGILAIEGFDTSLAEGLMMLTPFAADAKDEKTVSFVTKYQEKFGGVPNQFAADAYDGIYALAAACEKAGVTADTAVEDACDMIIAAMQEIQVEGLTGTMTWDAAGTVTKTPTAVVIKDGAYVSAE